MIDLNQIIIASNVNSKDKGFWEDWDLADELETIADENPELDLEEVEKICRAAAVALRRNIIGMKLALLHSEVSEMLSIVRDVDPLSLGQDEDFNHEGADVLIRLGDLFGHLGGNLADATVDKQQENAKRPYKHGRQA